MSEDYCLISFALGFTFYQVWNNLLGTKTIKITINNFTDNNSKKFSGNTNSINS